VKLNYSIRAEKGLEKFDEATVLGSSIKGVLSTVMLSATKYRPEHCGALEPHTVRNLLTSAFLPHPLVGYLIIPDTKYRTSSVV
jgi:hypothetical protein